MKKIMKSLPILLTLVLLSAAGFNAVGQNKFAHVNSQEILFQMPGIDQMQQELQDFQMQMQETYQALVMEFQTKSADFEGDMATMSQTVRQNKQRELESLRERIISFERDAEEEIMMKRESLLNPIVQKAIDAIEEIAKEKGYDYVFDTGGGSVLYANPSDDITTLVKAKLGIE